MSNEYVAVLTKEFYNSLSKADFAALAVSLSMLHCEDDFSKVEGHLKEEADTLKMNNIIKK